jgi:hypothetical protein
VDTNTLQLKYIKKAPRLNRGAFLLPSTFLK